MQTKWISSSSHRDSRSGPSVRPGAFSNQTSSSKQLHEPQNGRSGRTYHLPDQKRSIREKVAANTSFEGMSKVPNYGNSENEPYGSTIEANGPSMISEQYYLRQNMSSQPLAERNNNQSQTRESRSQPHKQTANTSTIEKHSKVVDENTSRGNQQGSYVKILQHSQSLSKNRESNSKSPLTYSKRKMTPSLAPANSSRKISRPQSSDEKFIEPSQPKVVRSQSSLVIGGNNNTESKAETKAQNNMRHHQSSEGFFNQEQDTENLQNMQKMKKENQELLKNLNKLTAELQNEKKKCAVLEAEVENSKNDLVKEREKYKDELCKISLQIKKLRNIQNIYVTEKKNSEKLENQLNIKEKALSDTSQLLCESLKSMVSVLELVLLKGDVALDKHWKARDFNPDMMFKLFNDVRRVLLPKVEEADSHNLSFEWKCQDYKDIVTHTKEFLKLRKTTSAKILNSNKENEFQQKTSPMLPANYAAATNNSANMNNTIFSPVFAQAENNFIPPSSLAAANMPKQMNEPEVIKSKPLNDSSSKDKTTSKSLTDLHAQLQKINEYVPLHARMSLAEIKMQEEINQVEEPQVQNKSMEVIQEDRCMKKRASSVSRCWDNEAAPENFMAASLGSTIDPRTNNCSGFAETFDNFLGDNGNSRINSEDKRRTSISSTKNYDLPIAMPSIIQNTKHTNELEAAKNKLLKTKHNIESRRMSSIGHDPNFLLEQPDIIEISDESMTSFQKTVDEDNMQRQSHKETVHNQEHNFTLKMNKVPSQPVITKDSDRKESRPDSGSSRKDDMPLRLTRSSSSVTVIPDDGQKSLTQNQQMKKEHSQRSLTQDSHRETSSQSRELSTDRKIPSARSSSEHFAVAKYDYNAQKENDLSFSQGDKIKILRKTETGWWIGLCNNKIGYFPSNFVES